MNFLTLILSLTLQAQAVFSTPFPAGTVAARPKPDAVLAKVNGVAIRASDVEAVLWEWRAFEATQELISYELINAEAKRLKITVTEAEIGPEVKRQLEEVGRDVPAGKTLDQALKEQGFPRSRLYLRVKTDLLLNKIALADFRPQDHVKVGTILVKPASASATDLGDAIKTSQEAYDRLVKGEGWNKVLTSTVKDPTLTRDDGTLGWRALPAFPQIARQELSKLPVGGYTRPVQTANGIQIFRVMARGQEASPADLEELRKLYLPTARNEVLARLKKDAKVERFF